jgi:hypothetical protein
MSDLAPVVTGIVQQANPFLSIAPIFETGKVFLAPYVGMLSSQTTSLIVGDDFLAFYVTLIFMVSLITIVLSDRVGWTRSLRYTALSAHFALLRVFRCMITIGLFFVGRRIAVSGGSSEAAYQAAEGFLQTTTLTWTLQKMIEWFVSAGPHPVAYDPNIFNPIVDPNSFLQTIFQVVYDYLKLYNELVLNAMIGGWSSSNLSGLLTFRTVSGDKSQGATGAGNIRTLYQLHQTGSGGAGPTTQLEGAAVWYYSPLYAGVFAGLLA